VKSDETELNWTEPTWPSFWRTDQWVSTSSNALQWAPSNGVGVYAITGSYASTNDQWARHVRPLVSSSKI